MPSIAALSNAGSWWPRLLLAAALLAIADNARAADDNAAADDGDDALDIEFDRPGLAFATATLPAGGVAWEQGLPDATTDRRDGVRSTTYEAGTTLRLGLLDSLELQVEHDSLVHVTTRGQGARGSDTGSGNTSVGLLWALPGRSESFEWSLLGTATVARGRAPFGDDESERTLGMTASWNLTHVDSVTAFANRSWTREGQGWLFAADYVREVRDALEAYVEVGVGTGEERQRVVGAGMMWKPRPNVQLDASFLRGLDDDSPDWQAGVGFAVYFAPRAASR